MTMKKGLTVSVLRDANGYDCTMQGPSSKLAKFTLIDDAVLAPFEPDENAPEINLVRRTIGGHEYVHAVPASLAGKQVMFGGNFIYTSDSRFRKINAYPIPVHDRVEP